MTVFRLTILITLVNQLMISTTLLKGDVSLMSGILMCIFFANTLAGFVFYILKGAKDE